VRLKGNNSISLDVLDNAIRNAPQPSLELLSKIINGACTRIPALARAESVTQVIRLAEMGAWTEATIALIRLELPRWTVRRLIYESGEWLCSLSQEPNMPVALDDCAEASHEVLPLAMGSAHLRKAAFLYPPWAPGFYLTRPALIPNKNSTTPTVTLRRSKPELILKLE
jgi:hypothetical protein